MDLYFLRHGEADWPNWNKPDDERPLTGKGKKEMRKVAKLVEELDLSLDLILSSPLPRAKQTAEIVAAKLEIPLREERVLAKGFDLSGLKKILAKYASECVMIVGHEPDFTDVITALTGATLKLSKAGLALVQINPDQMRGRLLWLFPPKIAKAAGR